MSAPLIVQQRRPTRQVKIGSSVIGGDAPILVQSMCNTDTRDLAGTLTQIRSAAAAGAELMRVSVPAKDALQALAAIVKASPIPIAADIHFDHRLALGALEAGVHKLRINPGNIGSRAKVKAVIKEAKQKQIPVRVGVNAGSLEKDILARYGHPTADALAESALRNARWLLDEGFDNLILSLKGSDVPATVAAYRMVADDCDLPLHIGITESGTLVTGAIRSAVGLGLLLAEGIGDTLRVSLAADPLAEIRAGYRILEALGIRRRGPTVIACPTCSRTQIDIISLANQVEEKLLDRTAPLTVAVMGCIVNGPGEAREADLGIAGGRHEALLFRKGKPLRKVPEDQLLEALLALFDEVAAEGC